MKFILLLECSDLKHYMMFTVASIAKRAKPILKRPPPYVKSLASQSRTLQSFGSSPQKSSASAYASTRSSTGHNSISASSKLKEGGRALCPKEIDEKRAKNPLFFCDEKYFPSHKCKAQVYKLEIVEGTRKEGGKIEVMDEEIGEEL